MYGGLEWFLISFKTCTCGTTWSYDLIITLTIYGVYVVAVKVTTDLQAKILQYMYTKVNDEQKKHKITQQHTHILQAVLYGMEVCNMVLKAPCPRRELGTSLMNFFFFPLVGQHRGVI